MPLLLHLPFFIRKISLDFKNAVPAVRCPRIIEHLADAEIAAHLASSHGDLVGFLEIVFLRLLRHLDKEAGVRHGVDGIVLAPLAIQRIESMRGETAVFLTAT